MTVLDNQVNGGTATSETIHNREEYIRTVKNVLKIKELPENHPLNMILQLLDNRIFRDKYISSGVFNDPKKSLQTYWTDKRDEFKGKLKTYSLNINALLFDFLGTLAIKDKEIKLFGVFNTIGDDFKNIITEWVKKYLIKKEDKNKVINLTAEYFYSYLFDDYRFAGRYKQIKSILNYIFDYDNKDKDKLIAFKEGYWSSDSKEYNEFINAIRPRTNVRHSEENDNWEVFGTFDEDGVAFKTLTGLGIMSRLLKDADNQNNGLQELIEKEFSKNKGLNRTGGYGFVPSVFGYSEDYEDAYQNLLSAALSLTIAYTGKIKLPESVELHGFNEDGTPITEIIKISGSEYSGYEGRVKAKEEINKLRKWYKEHNKRHLKTSLTHTQMMEELRESFNRLYAEHQTILNTLGELKNYFNNFDTTLLRLNIDLEAGLKDHFNKKIEDLYENIEMDALGRQIKIFNKLEEYKKTPFDDSELKKSIMDLEVKIKEVSTKMDDSNKNKNVPDLNDFKTYVNDAINGLKTEMKGYIDDSMKKLEQQYSANNILAMALTTLLPLVQKMYNGNKIINPELTAVIEEK